MILHRKFPKKKIVTRKKLVIHNPSDMLDYKTRHLTRGTKPPTAQCRKLKTSMSRQEDGLLHKPNVKIGMLF